MKKVNITLIFGFLLLGLILALSNYYFANKKQNKKPIPMQESNELIGKNLHWIYPRDGYKTLGEKTFLYGNCDIDTKLFVSVNGFEEEISLFPNGNFAHVIDLRMEENEITLIQKQGSKKREISRKIKAGVVTKKPDFEVQDLSEIEDRNIKSKKRGLFGFGRKKKNKVIVIDPGHGGKEVGTSDPQGIGEKEYNLEISLLLYEKLMELKNSNLRTEDFEVYITREDDIFLSLNERVNFAREKKADILISIHQNALPDYENPLDFHGTEVFFWHKKSRALAKELLLSITDNTELEPRAVIKRNFALVRPDFCEAVLVECGYLIHPAEAEILAKQETKEGIAEGIINALHLRETLEKNEQDSQNL